MFDGKNELEKALEKQEAKFAHIAKSELDTENREKSEHGDDYPNTLAAYEEALQIKKEEVIKRN